ncbi:MAG: hypothetical protein PVH42_15150 [Desulfobacterales bacterium]|jgi:hypothetical protein
MNSVIKAFLASLLAVGVTACASLEKEPGVTVRQRIAESYGLQHFGQVEKIQYTFNVKLGEKQIRRFWIWEPAVDRVTFKGMDFQKAITYDRGDLARTESNKLKKIDAWFINDNYWLLFPFHVAWDTNAKVEDIGRRQLPMGDGKARSVVVTYPASGGYTPGDAYDLFLDDQYRLTHWVYRRGGADKPTRISTWDDHRKAGPLTVSLNHRGQDQSFRVWFTNVGVKMVGTDSWLFTQ